MNAVKIVKLSSRNLRVFIKQKKYLFFVILIGMSISISAVLFYFGYFIKNFEDSTSIRDVTLQLKLSPETANSQHIIDTLLGEKDNLPTRVTVFENDPNIFKPSGGEKQKINVVGDRFLNQLPPNLLLFGNSIELSQNDRILATPLALKQLGITHVSGQKVQVGNKEYNLAGLVAPFYYLPYESCIVISLEEFVSTHKVNSMNAQYDKNITTSQINDLSKTLSNLPGITVSHMPGKSNPLQSSGFLAELVQIVLIFLLSFINIFSLLHFWIESNRRNYSIYSLVGASKRDITCILTVNNIAISFACILFGTVLFVLVSPLLLQYKIISSFTFGRYSFILLILVALSLALSVVLSIRYNRNQKIYRISGE